MQLKLQSIALVFFVDIIDDESRQKYEKEYIDYNSGITVDIILIESG